MTNKITHAPQSVIDELNGNAKLHSPLRVLKRVEQNFFPETKKWVLANEGSENESKQVAIINHVFRDEKLQPEREPRYYVQNDTHGNTYWVLSKANVFHDREPAVWDFNMHGAPEYEEGMSETQADLFIQAFGGTKEKLV